MALQQLRNLVSALVKRREDFRDVLEMQNLPLETVRSVQGRSAELQYIMMELERIILGEVGENGELEEDEVNEDDDE